MTVASGKVEDRQVHPHIPEEPRPIRVDVHRAADARVTGVRPGRIGRYGEIGGAAQDIVVGDCSCVTENISGDPSGAMSSAVGTNFSSIVDVTVRAAASKTRSAPLLPAESGESYLRASNAVAPSLVKTIPMGTAA